MGGREETIAIIDYGMGNLRSVANAFLKLNRQNALRGQCKERLGVLVTREAEVILRADKIILPGVGAFGECMHNLKKYGLVDPIYRVIEQGKPFLGICVGLQLLFEGSEEDPGTAGLGIFKGMVKKIDAPGLKVPHIGWNSLEFKKGSQLFQGVEDGAYVYFVHSFFPAPADESIVTAVSFYGETITAAVHYQNIRAVQFHPEKSGNVGLKMLANFILEDKQRGVKI